MTSILTWLGPAIGAIVFLGAAAQFLRGSRDRGTIASLTASNAAYVESERLLERKVGEQAAEVTALKVANDVLTNTVNSGDKIEALMALIRKQGERDEQRHRETMTMLARLVPKEA